MRAIRHRWFRFVAIDQEIIALDSLFCQTLVGLSADNRDVPILVTRIPSRTQSATSRRTEPHITYHLRPDVRFADGVRLPRPTSRSPTAPFSIRAIVRRRSNRIAGSSRLRTPDPHTVVIRLRHPWNAAVRVLFAQADYVYGILPKHAFADTQVVGPPWENAPFGTGPFRVKSWLRGDRIILEPNPYYRPRPKLRQIVLEDRSEPKLQLRRATVGCGRCRNADRRKRRCRQSSIAGLRVRRIPENATQLLYLQTQAAPTSDVQSTTRDRARARLSARSPPPGATNSPRRRSFLPPPIVHWKSVVIPPYRHDRRAANRAARRRRLAHATRRSIQGRRSARRV